VTQDLLIAVAAIITLGIAAEWFAWRLSVPSILLLLIFGFLAGPVTGFLEPDEMLGNLLFPIVSISVAVILFEGGMSLKLRELRHIRETVRNLITIGALLTWVLAALAAHVLLDLRPGPAVLLGAILVVTGPTVIVPLLRQVRPVPSVASTLKWEGILIDPIGAMLAVLVFEAMLAGGVGEATTVAFVGLTRTVVIGGASAALGALLLVVLMDRAWVPDFLESPVSLMIVVAAFAVSNTLQPESGLLTATLMGIILTNQSRVDVRHIIEFKENLRVLLISSLFIILAARLQLSDLRVIGPAHLAFLALLMLVVRPLVVAVSTLGTPLNLRERAMIAWVAPRGIVAAAVASIFALELADAGYARADELVSITFFVIIGTVLIYGISAYPVARLLGVAQPDPQGVLIVGAHPWARAIASELIEEGVPVRLVDSNYGNISAARMAGLPVYYGSALSESALDRIELPGIGKLLALTANDEVNSLTALHFSRIFGTEQVYQLRPYGSDGGPRDILSHSLRGRLLFDERATYGILTQRFDAGADVKSTNLTETFDYERFKERYPDAVPLFVIEENGRLTVFTEEGPAEPGPGDKLIAIVGPVDGDPGGGSASPRPAEH
jgi:NhaP-type Na+/H+ or K+/H+ antiporter